jgi:hypothetical protein
VCIDAIKSGSIDRESQRYIAGTPHSRQEMTSVMTVLLCTREHQLEITSSGVPRCTIRGYIVARPEAEEEQEEQQEATTYVCKQIME